MIDFNKKLILAPMAGVTEPVFRQVCKDEGADIVMTEMVSADGLHYGSKKTLEIARVLPKERPCAVQLFGAIPENLSEAVKVINEFTSPEYIDLNVGCPVKKVVSKNGGSALLNDELLFAKIVTAMVEASSTPITVKIRYGWLAGEYVDTKFGKIAEECGASAIAIHPRSRSMGYTGKADWDRIRALKDAVNIPVIGNGDLFTWQDGINMYRETGCDSLMLARGSNGNPWIFRQLKQALMGEEVEEITYKTKVETARKHFELFCKMNDGNRGFAEMKKHLAWYYKGFPDAAHLRNAVFRSETRNALEAVIYNSERLIEKI